MSLVRTPQPEPLVRRSVQWDVGTGPATANGEVVLTPTSIVVNVTDNAGTDQSALLAEIVSGSTLRVKQRGAANWLDFSVTGVTGGGGAEITFTGTVTGTHGTAPTASTGVELRHAVPIKRDDVFVNTADD